MWKKRSDSFILVRLKTEAILASRGVDAGVVAEMVDRDPRSCCEMWGGGGVVSGCG